MMDCESTSVTGSERDYFHDNRVWSGGRVLTIGLYCCDYDRLS
jgi:hypothetical protein